MPAVTKTLHPLPFEHLEPKRFEDLVRQLAYDFRPWRKLEATGRSGSDEGYDIRGWEIATGANARIVIEGEDEPQEETGNDRLWLIQCKREQEIGPKKLVAYVEAIPPDEKARLYGIIVAVSCNISKKARDGFLTVCGNHGIAECYIWSRGEIEDMLFQPKNDGILFAYFGISLTIRRRSVSTELRSRLSTKRKVLRAFGEGPYISETALFLDPEADQYPYMESGQRVADLPWKVYPVDEYHARGIIVQTRSHFAFLDDDGVHWDAADTFNDMQTWDNPWALEGERRERRAIREELAEIHKGFPQQNRATLKVTALVLYEDIIEVDGDGDPVFNGPILYVSMSEGALPYASADAVLTSEAVYENEAGGPPRIVSAARILSLGERTTKRIEKFPGQFRRL